MPGILSLIILLGIGVVTLSLLALAWLAWRHFSHARRPEYQWAMAALGHQSQLKNRRKEALARLRSAAGSLASKVGPVWADAAVRAWTQVPVEELGKETNIGPGTVDMLRTARVRTAHDVETHYQLQSIPGIGPARAAYLRDALAECRQKTMSGLLAATSGPGLEARRQEEGFKVQFEIETDRASEEIHAIDREWIELLPVFALARWYRWKVLLSVGRPPLLPQGMRPFKVPDRSIKPQPPAAAPQQAPIARPATPPPAPSPSVPQPTEFRIALPKPQPIPQAVPKPSPPPSPPNAREVFEITGRLAVAAGFSDGRFVDSEREELISQLRSLFGASPELAPLIAPFVETAGKESLNDLWIDLDRLSMDQKRAGYRLCCRVVDAAGTRNAKESQFLEELQRGLGLSNGGGGAPVPNARSADDSMDVEKARAVLEIDPVATLSIDLVRRQHRLQQDRLGAVRPGTLGAEIEAMLKSRKDMLSKAATVLADSLGQPLDPPEKPQAPQGDPRHNPDLDAALGL